MNQVSKKILLKFWLKFEPKGKRRIFFLILEMFSAVLFHAYSLEGLNAFNALWKNSLEKIAMIFFIAISKVQWSGYLLGAKAKIQISSVSWA